VTDLGLHNLHPAAGSHRTRKRIGRGTASGQGKTSGRGQKGQKPEGDLAKALELFDQLKATTDQAKQIELGKQIVKLEADNLWSIGTVGAVPSILVVKNNFRNVPENAATDWIFMSPGNLDPSQFFYKKP